MRRSKGEKSWENIRDGIFERLDKKMKDGRLYLDYSMTLPKFSKITGTNRTYASKAICERYRNFRKYLNVLRVENLLADVRKERCPEPGIGDPDEMANNYGFRTGRSLDRILVKETGCTYRRIFRRRKHLK